MSDDRLPEQGYGGPSRGPTRIYVLIAAILAVIIIVAAVLLLTRGLPALRKPEETVIASTAASTPATPTPVPTYTPGPTRPPTQTPLPSPTPTPAPPSMAIPENPTFVFESAGARPGVDWTGFFGTVQDASGNPLPGVPLIVWLRDGQPASPVVETNQEGYYEIRLAEAPVAGTWTLQVLTADGQPASELVTFQTDENVDTGIQQVQVIWHKVP